MSLPGMQPVRAGYLPGIDPAEVDWQLLRFDHAATPLQVAVPVLTAAQMHALAGRVRQAAALHLRPMPVAQIIDVIDRAIARLLDRAGPWRQRAEALLPAVSGYDAEMVRLGLTGFFKTFRAPQLRRFVAEDFANPLVLDGFQPAAKGGAVRAFGPDLLVHSWAGNVPALALWSFVCGLLVKAGNIGKLPSAEPLFAGWFAQLLAEVHPPLADCFAVVWWKGAGGEDADALYAQADTVLAYGGNDALDAIRRRLPVTTRFLPHGHKLGFGLVGAGALDTLDAPPLARLAAWDVMRYDQQGCYSPHVFYVQRGGAVSPRGFADYLAAELANLHRCFPRRPLPVDEAAAVAHWRQGIEWKALSAAPGAPPGAQLIGAPADAWSVAYADTLGPLAPTALQRTVQVVAVDTLDDVPPVVARHRPFLQTAGVAAAPEELHRLAALLGAAGVTRVSAIGAMSTPEAGWHHDGRFNLLDLVRMVEIEASAETAAEPFARYAD